jgi:hypothetical protein
MTPIHILLTKLFIKMFKMSLKHTSGNTLFKECTALCIFVNSILNVCHYFYVMGCLFFPSSYCGRFVPQ